VHNFRTVVATLQPVQCQQWYWCSIQLGCKAVTALISYFIILKMDLHLLIATITKSTQMPPIEPLKVEQNKKTCCSLLSEFQRITHWRIGICVQCYPQMMISKGKISLCTTNNNPINFNRTWWTAPHILQFPKKGLTTMQMTCSSTWRVQISLPTRTVQLKQCSYSQKYGDPSIT
jgi:hypothetical protein